MGLIRLSGLACMALLAAASTAGADGRTGFLAFEKGDYATAFAEFLPLAEAGQPSAQAALGQMYLDGLGVAKDSAQAARWLELAADGGNARAQAQIGTMYLIGEGVAADPARAAFYTEAAANQNVARAQVDIAAMYFQGVGVARDPAKAYLYAHLAAAQGNEEGVGLKSYMETQLSPDDLARAQGLIQAWRPTVPGGN